MSITIRQKMQLSILSKVQDEHIIGSKYVRQVILGNCNPKRI